MEGEAGVDGDPAGAAVGGPEDSVVGAGVDPSRVCGIDCQYVDERRRGGEREDLDLFSRLCRRPASRASSTAPKAEAKETARSAASRRWPARGSQTSLEWA